MKLVRAAVFEQSEFEGTIRINHLIEIVIVVHDLGYLFVGFASHAHSLHYSQISQISFIICLLFWGYYSILNFLLSLPFLVPFTSIVKANTDE